jgi:tetratricopeptide (TPR) repeat protein
MLFEIKKMNIIQYNHIINKPIAINDKQTLGLEKMISEFPYFQSARALHLKGLYNQNSYSYNLELKKTAAHTTDRSILFDFITSENFIAIQKGFYDDKIEAINNIKVVEFDVVDIKNNLFSDVNNLEKSILSSISNSETEKIVEKLEIGKPLDFSVNEKHSFQEWLQISRIKPIIRVQIPQIEPIFEENNTEKQKKLELIDKFIESSPKIPKIDKNSVITASYEPKNDSNSYLMTETLAKVYLEQKKYDKAIQAYEILILKYPEKSSIFAIRIQDIKYLQKNN